MPAGAPARTPGPRHDLVRADPVRADHCAAVVRGTGARARGGTAAAGRRRAAGPGQPGTAARHGTSWPAGPAVPGRGGRAAVAGGPGPGPVPAPGVAGHRVHRGGDRAGAAGTGQLPGAPVGVRRAGAPMAARRGLGGRGGRVPAVRAPRRVRRRRAGTRRRDGSGWRLTGTHTLISNAPDADFYTVLARTTPGERARGVSAFLVPADRPGLSSERLAMVSPPPIGTLTFAGVPVYADELLGEAD